MATTAQSYTGTFKSAQTSLASGGKMLFENGKYQCKCGSVTPIGKRGGKAVGKRG